MADALSVAYTLFLAAGVGLLGAGFFWKDPRAHLARAAGWIVFGVYWFLHVPDYILQDDALNALGAAAALPLFVFVAHHERLSYRWREEYEPLRFACGAAFFASAVYFAFERVPDLAAVLVQAVADQTAAFLNALGYGFVSGGPECGVYSVSSCPSGEAVTVGLFTAPVGPGDLPVVNIVLACTALQGYAVAAALLLSTRDPWRRKAIGMGIVLPVTYVMNLVRNVVIIYFFGVRGDPFELVHNWYGKTLSLAVLLVLVFVAFKLLPELYVNINGLFELPWRRGPRHDYRRFVGRLSKKKGPTTPGPTGGTTPGAEGGSTRSTGGASRSPPSPP